MTADHAPLMTTVLFLPGANARALEKAPTLSVDAVIIDLEDAVAAADKGLARQQAAQAIAAHHQAQRRSPRLLVRLNGRDTPFWPDDTAMVRDSEPDGAVLPKIDSAADVLAAAEAVPRLPLYAMIETPTAVVAAAAIVGATPRLAGLIAGTNDLSATLGATVSADRREIMLSLQTMVLAAKAQGRLALDGVFNRIDDPVGLAAEAEQGCRLGFDGKCLIHPAQIAPVAQAFRPSAADLAEAQALIEAYAAGGGGVAVFRGRMIEALHARQAHGILKRAGKILR